MKTEIIKLNSLKNSIMSVYENLASVFKSKKQYDITLIVKEAESDDLMKDRLQLKNEQKPANNQIIFSMGSEEDLSCQQASLPQEEQKIVQSQNLIDSKTSKIQKTSKHLFPKKQDLFDKSELKIESKISKKQILTHFATQTANSDEIILKQDNLKQDNLRQSALNKSMAKSSVESDYSFKVNDGLFINQIKTDNSDELTDHYQIENELNHGVELIEANRFQDLENFLYNFKERHTYIGIRSQVKWNLLMAYCKEAKRQYERATPNYIEVINQLQKNPKLLFVDLGQIYHHVGICYTEMKKWNQGIVSFSKAINTFKKSRKIDKLIQAMNNLGVLYLEVNYYVQAERCFLMAYQLKKEQNYKNPESILLTMFNLVECNLKIKNIKQVDILIDEIEIIINSGKIRIDYFLNFKVKKAKIAYIKGDIELAQRHCHQYLNIIEKNWIEPERIIQAVEFIGIIQIEVQQYEKSLIYFEQFQKILQATTNLYDDKLEIIRSNIEMIHRKIAQKKNIKVKEDLKD